MTCRASTVLSPALILAVGLPLFFTWAGAANATTEQFKVKICVLREYMYFDDEEEERDKQKYKRFFVDGRFGSPIAWRLSNDFSLSFGVTLDSQRKATYVKDVGLDPVTIGNVLAEYQFNDGFAIIDYSIKGKRKVDKKFKKSKDKFNFQAEVQFTDGPNMGRNLFFGLRAKCDGKVVKQR